MPPSVEPSHDYPLATLSIAAEHAALQIPYITPPARTRDIPIFGQTRSMAMLPEASVSLDEHASGLDFEHLLDRLASFICNGTLSTYHFSSLTTAEQPMPCFSPESFLYPAGSSRSKDGVSVTQIEPTSGEMDETGQSSLLGSRLTPPQPEEHSASLAQRSRAHRPLTDISDDDRRDIILSLNEFSSVIHSGFQLPSRIALSRYVAGYVKGFHEHLPFLHLPTLSVHRCSVELILAMAAVGTQYCFEAEKGIGLFYTSQAIAMERIRRRDARMAALYRRAESELASATGGMDDLSSSRGSHQPQLTPDPLGFLPDFQASPHTTSERQDLMQTAQALLILMALATWAKHREMLREALAIQSVLGTLIRDDGLKSYPVPEDVPWEEWVQIETNKRTKLLVYCLFNLHCVVYNIPSLILNSEVNLTLPCSAAEFKAPTSAKWLEARKRNRSQANFQDALTRLFLTGGNDITECNSSLGNYILIHAIIQHIFFLRQVTRGRFTGNRDMAPEDTTSLELALRNWQIGWRRNAESSLEPLDPNGPVAFNSTALLRLAYIRLNIDIGPGRALDTRDPVQIARAFREIPAINRVPKLVRVVLHSAHALSIPVKIGIRLAARTQTFIWSIQHSLCSLECAFLLSKWLEALSLPNPEPEVTEGERRIAALVKMMLDETEFAVASDQPLESPAMIKKLNAGVLRVWAKIFKGTETWAIIDVIGSSLNAYADMIDAG
jgi:hypothetical protein